MTFSSITRAVRLSRLCAAMASGLVAISGFSAGNPANADPLRGAKNLPPSERVDFIMGQDGDTLLDFKRDVLDKDRKFPKPTGVTLYTSLNGVTPLGGLWSPVDFRVGRSHFEEIISTYSGVIALGIELRDYSQDLNTEARNLSSFALAGDPSVDPEVVKRYRGWMDELILFMKKTRRKVFFRLGYEFDGHWNNYEPEAYKKAFRYVHQRLRELKAHKIAMVWQTAAWANQIPDKQVLDKSLYDFAGAVRDGKAEAFLDSWYPGDDVVDWMGVSQFMTENYLRENGPYDCERGVNLSVVAPREVQDAFLNYARAHNKPVMMAEAAPAAYDNGELTVACRFKEGEPWAVREPVTADQIWDEWYAATFSYIRRNRDIIRSFAYINADWDSQLNWDCQSLTECPDNYWGDSRIQANPTILARFKAEVSDRQFWTRGRGKARPFEGPDFSVGRGVYEAEYAEGDTWLDCCGLGALHFTNLDFSNERESRIMNFGDQGAGTYGLDFERVVRGSGLVVTLAGQEGGSPDETFSVLIDGELVAGPVPIVEGVQDYVFDIKVPKRSTIRVQLNPNSGGDIMFVDKIKVTR